MPTEEITTFAKLINDYGLAIVLSAVFLFIVIINNKKMQKNYSEMNKSREESNKILLDSILNQNKLLTEQLKSSNNTKEVVPLYDEKNIVEIFVKLNEVLKTECQETSRETNSDRTAIYVFHNGTHSSHGLPFFKMSCVCEWINKGAASNTKLSEHTNMTLNLFEPIVSNLYKNGEFIIDSEKEKDPSNLLFIKSTKIKKAIFIAIYDEDNNIMGFVANDYNKDIPLDIEIVKEKMQTLCDKVKPVLEFSNYQEMAKE